MTSMEDGGRRGVVTWERLVRYQRAAVRAMDERLRSTFGHPLEDYDVLHQAAVHRGPIRMGELADRLVVANSSCTRIVGRLVAAGLLERRRGPHDRREVLVVLTPAGQRLHRRMAAAHTRDIERHFSSRLSDAALDGLDRAVGELLAGTGAPDRATESPQVGDDRSGRELPR